MAISTRIRKPNQPRFVKTVLTRNDSPPGFASGRSIVSGSVHGLLKLIRIETALSLKTFQTPRVKIV